MPTKIVVPELGESIFEATVSRWLKQEGEQVKVGEPVVELETDKVNLEVSAEHGGVLVSIERGEGEDVEIGEVLAMIEEAPAKEETPQAEKKAETAEEDITKTGEEKAEAAKEDQEQPEVASKEEPSQTKEEISKAEETASEAQREAPEEAKERATPVARRLAQDEGVDLAQVQTSRSDGRVTKQDVQNYIKQQEAEPKEEPAPSPSTRDQRERRACPAIPPPTNDCPPFGGGATHGCNADHLQRN